MKLGIDLNEVGPRDWKFSHCFNPGTKAVFRTIKLLEDAGIKRIEIGASVNYDKYPYMKDTFELFSMLKNSYKNSLRKGARYSVYVGPYKENYPKIKINSLLEKKLLTEDTGLPDELSFSISASEKRNMELYHLTGNQVFESINRHIKKAKEDGVKFFRGYISSAFGYENPNDCSLGSVIGWAHLLLDLGCYEIALGDSRGHATPNEFFKKWNIIKTHLPLEKIALHFHENNYLTWETDIVKVLEEGLHAFDTSIMDIPNPLKDSKQHDIVFKDNIPPNASTEKMVYFIDKQINSSDYPFKEKINPDGISTDLDYDKVSEAGKYIREIIANKKKRF